MPTAQFQGIVTVPLFEAPYTLPVVAQIPFLRNADFATVLPWLRLQPKSPNNWAGIWYDFYVMNPFLLHRFSNDVSETRGTGNIATNEYYMSGDGRLYSSGAGQTAVTPQNYTYAYTPWSFFSDILRDGQVMANDGLNFGGPWNLNAPVLTGKCNVADVPGIRNLLMMATTGFGTNRIFVTIPELNFSWANIATNFNPTQQNWFQVISRPDFADGQTTHLAISLPNGPAATALYYAHIAISTGLLSAQTLQYEPVFIDNGLGANAQSQFNNNAMNWQDVRRAGPGWLVQKLTSTSSIKHLYFNNNFTQYWGLNFVPQSIRISAPLTNSLVTSAHIDPLGIVYTQAGASFLANGAVGHSYGFNLPWYPLPTPQAPTFSLPCPPPCVNLK